MAAKNITTEPEFVIAEKNGSTGRPKGSVTKSVQARRDVLETLVSEPAKAFGHLADDGSRVVDCVGWVLPTEFVESVGKSLGSTLDGWCDSTGRIRDRIRTRNIDGQARKVLVLK